MAALAAMSVLVAIAPSRGVDEWYWQDIAGPQLREDLGFETGYVDSDGGLRLFSVTRVLPGGGFDRAGIQAGDIYCSYHGFPAAAFYSTLDESRGGSVTLDLKRPPDWRPVTVTVEVPAAGG